MSNINSMSDFNSVVDTIKVETTLITPVLSDRLKTTEMNTFFADLESELNTLYTKTRLIQDLTDFARARILSEGTACLDQINEINKNIDQAIDSYLNKSYIVKTIDITNIASTKDNDDSDLPLSIYNNGNIIMPAATLKTAAFKSIVPNRAYEYYEDNSDELLKRPYRVVYKMEQILDSIQETLNFVFYEEVDCNYINLQLSNCKIISVSTISSDNLEQIVDISNNYIAQRKIISLKVVIECDNYKTELLSADQQYLNRDFLTSASTDYNAENYVQGDSIKTMEASLSDNNNIDKAVSVSNAIDAYTSQLTDTTDRNNNIAAISSIVHVNEITADDLTVTISSDDTNTKYVYSFGIDSLIIESRNIKNSSGGILTLDIGVCKKIELEADTIIKDGDSIEFYLIDNGKDVLILPVELQTAALSSSSITGLKIIQRCSDNTTPPTISRLAIRQYEEETVWTL